MMAHLPQGQLCSNEQIEELVSATPGPGTGRRWTGRRGAVGGGQPICWVNLCWVNLCCNKRISRESKYHLTKQQSVTTIRLMWVNLVDENYVGQLSWWESLW